MKKLLVIALLLTSHSSYSAQQAELTTPLLQDTDHDESEERLPLVPDSESKSSDETLRPVFEAIVHRNHENLSYLTTATDVNHVLGQPLAIPSQDPTFDFPPTEVPKGVGPLHFTAMRDYSDAFKMLMGNSTTDVNIQGGKARNTPLILAIVNNHPKIALQLINHQRINVDLANRRGDSPLHYATAMGALPLVRLLVNIDDITVNAANQERTTPLMLAVSTLKFIPISDAILRQEYLEDEIATPDTMAFVDPTSDIGVRKEVFDCLMDKAGIDIGARDAQGRSALTILQELRDQEVPGDDHDEFSDFLSAIQTTADQMIQRLQGS